MGFEWDPGQRIAIETEGRDLLVTAGAGTGKTTVLVERIIRKLKTGLVEDLDSLLVVTFTEKAAQEMKERVYGALSQDPELRRFLPQLPRAPMSTIHGFCSRLLREQFLLAGIEPGFRILDENGQVEALDEALRKTFHEWYRKGDAGSGRIFQSLVELAGFDEEGERLRKIVRRLYEYARATPRPEAYLEQLTTRQPAAEPHQLPWYPSYVARLGMEWSEGTQLYGHSIDMARADGRKVGKHEDLLSLLGSFHAENLGDTEARDRWIDQMTTGDFAELDPYLKIKFPRAPSGANKIAGFADCYKEAKKRLDGPWIRQICAPPEQLLQEEADLDETLTVLIQLVREMDALYDLYKRRNGFLDFSDLEIETVRLIDTYGDALGLRDRFEEILVDEYQDVNGLQERILSGVSREHRRFRVGDVKQSIYQFRLADPTIFLAQAEQCLPVKRSDDVPEGDQPLAIYLTRNHRSRPAVIDVVNRVFSEIFEPDVIGSPYADQALESTLASRSQEYPVELHLVEVPRKTRAKAKPSGSDPESSDAFDQASQRSWSDLLEESEDLSNETRSEIEARLVALRLKQLEGEVAWKDVALLLRSRSRAAAYLQALEREGIPAFLSGGGSLLEEPAVRDMISLLSVIDNPRDDVALAAFLRSPLVGLSDSQLLRIRLAYPDAQNFLDAVVGSAHGEGSEAGHETGRFLPPIPDGTDPSSRFDYWVGRPAKDRAALLNEDLRHALSGWLDRIALWRGREQEMELGRFLLGLIEETHLLLLLHAGADGARQRAAVEKLLELARSYESERGPSLHGFLRRLETLDRTRPIDGVPAVGAVDGVSVLTIHAAKGLEFPVVVLPQLEWSFRVTRDLGDRIRIGPDWVGLRQLDFKTWGRRDTLARQTLEWLETDRSRAEEARIFYVALTRAKERLILVAASKKRPWEDPPLPAALRDAQLRNATSALDWINLALPWDQAEIEEGSILPPSISEFEGSLQLRFPDLPLRVSVTPAVALSAIQQDRVKEEAKSTGLDEKTAAVGQLLSKLGSVPAAPPIADLEGLRGKYWVTEFKKVEDFDRHRALEEEASGFWSAPDVDPAQRGILYHMALERLDLTSIDPADLSRQFDSLSQTDWWGGAERSESIEHGIQSFFQSELGQMMGEAALVGRLEREVAFSLKWPLSQLAEHLPSLSERHDRRWSETDWQEELGRAWVLLQGRIDAVFSRGDEWFIVDWKTDPIPSEQAVDRAKLYTSQMRLYIDAVSKLWGSPARAYLSFLSCGEIVPIEGDPD